MKKIFLHQSKLNSSRYWISNKGLSCHQELIYLWESFSYTNQEISVNRDEDGWVTIWSYWDMKDKKRKKFISLQEAEVYDQAYSEYWYKRYAEIPKLEITQQNYDDIVAQWEKINKAKKTKYVVIIQDDFGVVSFELKDELSREEQKYLDQDLEKYNKFIEKLRMYELVSGGGSRDWSGPEDSEFYSDFLTPDEMLWKSKKF